MKRHLRSILIALVLALYFTACTGYLLFEDYSASLMVFGFSFLVSLAIQIFREELVLSKKITESASLLYSFGAFYVLFLVFLFVIESRIDLSESIHVNSWYYELLIITLIPMVLSLWNLEVKLFNVNYRSISFENTNEDGARSELTITSESTKKELSLDITELIMIEAEDNYCMIFFKTDEGVRKELFRSTLKTMHLQLENIDSIHRVHRSFLINDKHLEKTLGKAQNYKLTMEGIDRSIPVSRNFDIKVLKQPNR